MYVSFYQKCSFIQTDRDTAIIIPEEESQPKKLNIPKEEYACPYYFDKEVCCNEFQNSVLNNNFKTIDTSFSHLNDGCDICSINLKRLWCDFTCHPEQRSFSK
jgi:hypothetical protein